MEIEGSATVTVTDSQQLYQEQGRYFGVERTARRLGSRSSEITAGHFKSSCPGLTAAADKNRAAANPITAEKVGRSELFAFVGSFLPRISLF
jgi:hypothetical protein